MAPTIGPRVGCCSTRRAVDSVTGRLPGQSRPEEAPISIGGGSDAVFMDVHHVDGSVSAADVTGAHQKDVETEGRYGVNYKRHWVDESAGNICRLVEAPDADTAHRVHREAHGLVADEIYEVNEGSWSARARATGLAAVRGATSPGEGGVARMGLNPSVSSSDQVVTPAHLLHRRRRPLPSRTVRCADQQPASKTTAGWAGVRVCS